MHPGDDERLSSPGRASPLGFPALRNGPISASLPSMTPYPSGLVPTLERIRPLAGRDPGTITRNPNAAMPGPAPTSRTLEVRDLHKRFRVPGHRPETFKERAIRPFKREERRSAEGPRRRLLRRPAGWLHRNRGRNGSGKSTLLKLLASIYRADQGSIRIAGESRPLSSSASGSSPNCPRARISSSTADDGPQSEGGREPLSTPSSTSLTSMTSSISS